jgi:hypothetical protein
MRTLLLALLLAAAPHAALASASTFQAGAAPLAAPQAHPALYSFSDVYRLTVGGAMGSPPLADAAPDAPVRVQVAQAQAAEPRFSITPVRQPEKWLLALAGLALAGWVAHRRLAHAL